MLAIVSTDLMALFRLFFFFFRSLAKAAARDVKQDMPGIFISVFIISLLYLETASLCAPLFIIPANLDGSPSQRQITLSRISDLINLQALEGITLPVNNYSHPGTSSCCQNVATTIFYDAGSPPPRPPTPPPTHTHTQLHTYTD